MTYSLGVNAAGIQAVDDLSNAGEVGPRYSYLKTLPADAADLPSGAVISTLGSLPAVLVDVYTHDVTFDRWNLRGYAINVNGSHKAKFMDSACFGLGTGHTGYILLAGDNGSNPSVEFSRCDLDFDADLSESTNGAALYGTGMFTATRNRFRDPPLNFITGIGCDSTITFNYITGWGLKAVPGAHDEGIHYLDGTHILTDNKIDATPDGAMNLAGGTGHVVFEPHNTGSPGAPMVATVRRNLFRGVILMNSVAYNIQAGSPYGPLTLEYTGNVMQPGSSGYVGGMGTGFDWPWTVTGSGNFDDVTGVSIDGAMGFGSYTPAGGSPDTTPDAFHFTDRTGAALATPYTSNTITVAGIDSSASISITGGQYSKNGGALTSASGSVVSGDTVSLGGVSSAVNSTAVNVVLTIGGISDTFTITTIAASAPDIPAPPTTSSPPPPVSPTTAPAPNKGGVAKALARFLAALFGRKHGH